MAATQTVARDVRRVHPVVTWLGRLQLVADSARHCQRSAEIALRKSDRTVASGRSGTFVLWRGQRKTGILAPGSPAPG